MDSQRFRAIFFGSPTFAVPSLDALVEVADVAGVVCQPDRPAGRGLDLSAPAVKVRAAELGLCVMQPAKLKAGDFQDWVRARHADVALVVAYGRILPRELLSIPRAGYVNVHASLLPKYRGAAPIARAIANGEVETGVTLMRIDEGLDTGPSFARVSTPIGPDESAGALAQRLSRLGADAVRLWLPVYVAGGCTFARQDDAQATLAPLLDKQDGRIDWTRRAKPLHDHVRAMHPWPGAFTTARGRPLKVLATRILAGASAGATSGRIVLADKSRVLVACGQGEVIELATVQPEGRRAMSAAQWSMGRGISEGDVLG